MLHVEPVDGKLRVDRFVGVRDQVIAKGLDVIHTIGAHKDEVLEQTCSTVTTNNLPQCLMHGKEPLASPLKREDAQAEDFCRRAVRVAAHILVVAAIVPYVEIE